MAVTKTPRKKPIATVAEVEKPAAKTKATPTKKAAPKKADAPEPKARKTAKTPVKTKVPEVVEPAAAAVEPAVPAPPAPKPVAKKATPASALPPLVEAVLAAIRDGRAVEFIFADTEANAPRTFEPRQLTFDALSQAWFVWGWDRRYNAERHHRVDLLAEVNDVEGVGRAAQGPYTEGTAANQIGGWLGGEPIAVKATLLKQWVFAVKQAPPAFPHFKLEEQGDGQALVTFTATDLRAIARWAMQFGDGIQVLEPARLVDRIKQVGAVWAGRDRQAAAPAPRPAPRPEPRPEQEPRRHEPRHHAEAKPEARPEPKPHREPRPEREREEAPKGKPGKVEVIHFDRL
ncbi:helix-turn-helix transcriptional regulator [Geothrix oryzisoli]|uniref:helix-turn-helix transcriptional regulator n=1 Tax=Geothrix oryzisoli TaxID=2922721 RepID=UPI001FAB43D2|nr:WYL domain-containing protein [Geothrix oryzisoli]